MSTEPDPNKRNFFDIFGIDRNVFAPVPETFRSWTTVSLTIGLIVFSLGVLISAILLFRLGVNALFSPDDSFQDAAKNFLFALAGAFGAPFLVWRTWVAHLQANAATAQANTALESHLTGIFAKSVELLGLVREVKTIKPDGSPVVRSLPNLESRLGALYSLERLLRESNKDQQAILETLCAYVRENSPLEIPEDENERDKISSGKQAPEPSRRTDVQAAITIIGRRLLVVHERGRREGWRLDLREANLVGYDFSGLNFDGSDFTGSFLNFCKLNGASFENSIFSNTLFCGAELNRTKLTCSSLNHCNFSSEKIKDSDFSLTTIENTDLREAHIISLDIRGANLKNAFSSWLEFSVTDAIKNGATSFNAMEIVRTNELFKKAHWDETTALSKTTLDAIGLMKQA
ncbi:pentapeptide repeat-containing protein [Afipia massiliensis]|uniref:Pentapeptide repeat-containing protein n=1 Tax=Afipia massiliensis TaxID=211460 RepID=A0A4U6BRI9_9BRAD|nr:pentapeptide repeat-containing protein [Afipia massiliensis]TKT73116.1 pentapeptide repeat-containing protein [Afipia massiliensis]